MPKKRYEKKKVRKAKDAINMWQIVLFIYTIKVLYVKQKWEIFEHLESLYGTIEVYQNDWNS